MSRKNIFTFTCHCSNCGSEDLEFMGNVPVQWDVDKQTFVAIDPTDIEVTDEQHAWCNACEDEVEVVDVEHSCLDANP